MIAKYGLIGFPLWLLWKWATVWWKIRPEDCESSALMSASTAWMAVVLCIVLAIRGMGAPTWFWCAIAVVLALPLVLPACRAVNAVVRFLFVNPDARVEKS